MRDILGESLKKLKWIRIRKNRMGAVLLVLSLVVSLNVFWFLRQPGLTLAGDATCGIQEHAHDEACGSRILSCTQEEGTHSHDESCYTILVKEPVQQMLLTCESTEEEHEHSDACYTVTIVEEGSEEQILICELPEEGHIHDESCYEWSLTCQLEEHTHSVSCYADETADVETMLDWQNMFAGYPFTGNLRKDLVGIAKTQVGYTESERNFQISDDGIRHGYTRYGAWYGTPYRDWSAAFVSFCLNYAKADDSENPGNTGASAMAERWKNLGKYAPAGEYTPVPGDLVFFKNNTVGIVADVKNATVYVIGGDIDDAVKGANLAVTDSSITGWGITEKPEPTQEETQPLPTEEPTESIQEETQPIPTEEPTEPAGDIPAAETESVTEQELLDISNGPAVFIFVGRNAQPAMQRFSLRSARSAVDLMSYLESKGGTYFFTLMDKNNQELPKDDDGNYIAQAQSSYKLTLTIKNPEGFLRGTYQYQIPNGLMVDGGEGNFVLSDGTNVGSWVVTDTGLITLDFNENINNRTEITISATMGIHFPEQDDPIDFDGLIKVKIEPPEVQKYPTVLSKWGSGNGATGKINWTIRIDGYADSQIPGNILTDQADASSWAKPHSYTESDMAAGISFGASDPNGGWHSWHVSVDDPHVIWTETGWSYKVPQTVTCDSCGALELGNEGWSYYINYSSTPDKLNKPGTFDYENKATIDGQTAWGWSNFTHGEIQAVIQKNGSFVSDAGGSGFLWEVQVTVPGRPEGQRAEYSWFIQDEMRLQDANGLNIGKAQNDAHLSMVTATYNGTTIQIPRIQDATAQDLFAWDNAWTGIDNGVGHTRTINLLCRCQCTPETCHWQGCSEYWFQQDDGTWAAKGFCQCWTETQNMTFTFVYKTTDLSVIEGYGALGYQLNNHAQMFYMSDNNVPNRVSYDDATVAIPNLFEKELTKNFDGYTANYKITVNEAKQVLTDGSPLYIRDIMTDTLAYISGSLVITAEDANGNVTQLQQGTDFTVTYDGSGGQTGANGKPVHIVDIVILNPQPVMYTLDYDTTLIIPENVTGAVKYSNSAEIILWGESIKDDAAEKLYADINIAAKIYQVELRKSDAKTGVPLQGATFGLYNEHGGLITFGQTDGDGKLLFQTNIEEGIVLREHVLYYVQELNAPNGYKLDDTKYWFCFCSDAGDSCEVHSTIAGDTGAIRIPLDQVGHIPLTNERLKYELPATGGPGIYPLILVSVILVITPLVYGFIRRRKQERRGVG